MSLSWLAALLAAGSLAAASAPLLTAVYSGGLCSDGTACRSRRTVTKDGWYLKSEQGRPSGRHRLSKSELKALTRAVRKADLEKIRSVKFTGTCPSAYDGQEAAFTLHLEGGDETVSACEFAIDFNAEPFSAYSKLYDKWK